MYIVYTKGRVIYSRWEGGRNLAEGGPKCKHSLRGGGAKNVTFSRGPLKMATFAGGWPKNVDILRGAGTEKFNAKKKE